MLACRMKLMHYPCDTPKEVFTSRSEPDDDLSVSCDDFSVSRCKLGAHLRAFAEMCEGGGIEKRRGELIPIWSKLIWEKQPQRGAPEDRKTLIHPAIKPNYAATQIPVILPWLMNYPGVSGLDVRNFYKLANSISGLFTIQSGREKVSNSNLISIPQGLTLKQTNSEKGIVRMTTIHDRTVRILPHIFVSSSTSSAANKRNNIKRDDEMGVIGVPGDKPREAANHASDDSTEIDILLKFINP
ncbi:hypothetical protein GEV33_013620 [Tenebrio molitor]|uniref:Uncharacterized protein n=1 Tax=Tenebrio molitor TaxID=7067 RepID=A0A8J6H6U4_TENMO|nr:hypothetical protein GEV33_013620 [Tenebrio molitor]